MSGFVATYGAIAFGLRWISDVPLHQFAEAPTDVTADIVIRRVAEQPHRREALERRGNAFRYADGIRFELDEEAIVDFFAPGLIEWLPGPAWAGRFSPRFFGTITALVLAWRGGLPMHGTSVEIDGRAYLLCGASGAGKSTLGAALVASGAARLIADDLTVLETTDKHEPPVLHAGRPAIRLFPAIAHAFEEAGAGAARVEPGSDKLLLEPARVPPFLAVPLAATILLGHLSLDEPPWRREALLRDHRFRPQWMDRLPESQSRDRTIRHVTMSLPMLFVEALDFRDLRACERHANALLDRIVTTKF